jgi:hypothetical protein
MEYFNVIVKAYVTTGLELSRLYLTLGLAIAFLFFIIHEVLHAICFPKSSPVYFHYTNQGLGTTSAAPITRARFLGVNLLPVCLLGIVPLIAWLFMPKEFPAVNSLLPGFSVVHFCALFQDVYNVFNVISTVSANAIIQISGARIYW